MFSFWDRLFGAYSRPSPEREATHGLRQLAADSGQTVAGMMLTPFARTRFDAALMRYPLGIATRGQEADSDRGYCL
jgi:hypothetical protein